MVELVAELVTKSNAQRKGGLNLIQGAYRRKGW